jgi:hypothetical protein
MSWILQAAGGLVSAGGTLRGARADANAMKVEAAASGDQAARDEEAQRRAGRQSLGAQSASFAQAGGGVDEGVIKQSAVNAELDALNIRYGGQMRSTGLLNQAQRVKSSSKWLAGAQLLSSGAGSYQSYKLTH